MTTSLRKLAALSLAGIGLGMIGAGSATAQAPNVYFACYVPSSGAVYRIKEPNTPATCGTTVKRGETVAHVEFSWTDAVGADHGTMTGLGDDDHPQYLPAEGFRTSTNGFAVLGTLGSGSLPAVQSGTHFAWYPGKGAFRAGYRSTPIDPSTIGNLSIAMGEDAGASGEGGIALGFQSRAPGSHSLALSGGGASGSYAFAVGEAQARAIRTVAIGFHTTSDGIYSWAIGTNAHTNSYGGSFVFGDASTVGAGTAVKAMMDNHFVARAQRFWFGRDNNVTATAGRLIETSTGAFLSNGGAWTNSSDSAKKAGFQEVDGDDVLAKLAAMPIRTWNYRSEDSTVRHMGPTAQDFRAAFRLGDGDKAIATVDADGVSLAAVQALVRRLGQLEAQVAELQVRISEAGGRR